MTSLRRNVGSLAIAACLVARAQQLLQEGNELFWAGHLPEALQLFEEAHRAYPSSKLFFNIARCEEGLDRRARALAHYQRFLREATTGEPLARAEAEQHVSTLSATLVAVELVDAPANAAIQIDGEPAGLTPLDGPLWLEPGTRRLSIDRAGQPLWVTSVTGEAGAKIVVKIAVKIALNIPKPELPAANPDTGPGGGGVRSASGEGHPDGRSTSPLRRWWWLWTGLGLAVVGGATAIYLMTRCPVSKGVCE